MLQHLTQSFVKFYKDEEAASAVEYGLLAAMIAGVIITALTTLGGKLNTSFTRVGNSIN